MFNNTLTITDGAASKVLTRINQDKYSSEYSLKETLLSYRIFINHTRSTRKTDGKLVDNVRVRFEKTVFATAVLPQSDFSASISFPTVSGNDPIMTRDLVRANIALLTSAFVDGLVQGEC